MEVLLAAGLFARRERADQRPLVDVVRPPGVMKDLPVLRQIGRDRPTELRSHLPGAGVRVHDSTRPGFDDHDRGRNVAEHFLDAHAEELMRARRAHEPNPAFGAPRAPPSTTAW